MTQEARVYTVDEVCAAAGIVPRTLKRWVAAGVVAAPTFRGRATRYDARQLAQARVARAMLSKGARLSAIAKVTSRATLEELHRITPPPVPPPPEAQAVARPEIEGMTPLRMLELLPGLSLLLREDATPFVEGVAAEIVARYRTRPAG
jgi:DNA-binding transcriptional MerR regulator